MTGQTGGTAPCKNTYQGGFTQQLTSPDQVANGHVEVGDTAAPVWYSRERVRYQDLLAAGIDQTDAALVDGDQQVLRVVGVTILLSINIPLCYALPLWQLALHLLIIPSLRRMQTQTLPIWRPTWEMLFWHFLSSYHYLESDNWEFATKKKPSGEVFTLLIIWNNTFFHSFGVCDLIRSLGMISCRKFLLEVIIKEIRKHWFQMWKVTYWTDCSSYLLSPKRTRNIKAANRAASSLVHLW